MRKIQCPVCKKYVSFFVPKGGDGSGVRVRRHVSALDGFTNPCDGYYMVIDYSGSAEDRRNRVLPDYNENGTANPKGDASYWRARAEAAEAKVSALQTALDAAINMNIEKNAKVAALTAALGKANKDAAFHPRAAKLMRKKKNFIAIACDEPYFMDAYDLIRDCEMRKGTWTVEDQWHYDDAKAAHRARVGAK